MASVAAVVVLRFELQNVNFWTAAVADYFCLNRGAINEWGADCYGIATDEEHGKLNGVAGINVEFFQADYIALGNPVLFTTRFNNCVHLS